MGYTITVGEAEIFYDADDPAIWIEAQGATDENAPDHCPFTGKGNSRSPGYVAWHEFCDKAGITELFYGQGWCRDTRSYMPCSDEFHRETPLLAEHPGAQPINQADAEYIGRKLTEYRRAHPDATPGFWDCGKHTDWKEVDNGKDPTLARLMWLEFWFRWALENCKRPIVQNT